jgi:rhodanese-related sulfurtransferase
MSAADAAGRPPAADQPSAGIDAMLARARGRLHRLRPAEAAEVAADGGVLVDIRPQAQRAREGEIPDALIIERNVLEWRFDPTHAARLPIASDELQVIVFCSEGYTSSLAAASLQQIGLPHATDLDGGFVAWKAAGLPTVPGGRATDG